eukprot:g686.t1
MSAEVRRVLAKVPTGVVSSTVEEAMAAGAAACIGTHNGTFHCDEALATALLKTLPAYKDHAIVRTRDPEQLAKCEIVVDVGGEYDAARRRFDHHQKTFSETLEGYATKLSSAGLVYKHYGRDVLRATLAELDSTGSGVADELIEVLYRKMYIEFVEHIDGIDNGVEVADGELRYKVSTTLSSRVSHLNPAWNASGDNDTRNAAFRAAMLLTGTEFVDAVVRAATSWWPARSLVQASVASAVAGGVDGCPPGEVLVLERYCPWQGHLFDLEAAGTAGAEAGRAKYVLYTDTSGMWRIQAVPVALGSFTSRIALPEAWRGLRDEALSKEAGVEGCTFAHAGGFIGGNATFDGVRKMAALAVANGGGEAPAPPKKQKA